MRKSGALRPTRGANSIEYRLSCVRTSCAACTRLKNKQSSNASNYKHSLSFLSSVSPVPQTSQHHPPRAPSRALGLAPLSAVRGTWDGVICSVCVPRTHRPHTHTERVDRNYQLDVYTKKNEILGTIFNAEFIEVYCTPIPKFRQVIQIAYESTKASHRSL